MNKTPEGFNSSLIDLREFSDLNKSIISNIPKATIKLTTEVDCNVKSQKEIILTPK